MKKNILNEIEDIKYLFNYNRGRILSEQELYHGEKIDLDEYHIEDDSEMMDKDNEISYDELYDEVYENIDFEVPTMMPGTKEIVKPGTKEREKTKTPGTPYRPKPGPKKAPKAEDSDFPDWLSFDELGINLR